MTVIPFFALVQDRHVLALCRRTCRGSFPFRARIQGRRKRLRSSPHLSLSRERRDASARLKTTRVACPVCVPITLNYYHDDHHYRSGMSWSAIQITIATRSVPLISLPYSLVVLFLAFSPLADSWHEINREMAGGMKRYANDYQYLRMPTRRSIFSLQEKVTLGS